MNYSDLFKNKIAGTKLEKDYKYESPLSKQTIKLRRCALISSIICLFIGYTEEIPSSFLLLGISLKTVEQKIMVGMFIFLISLYLVFCYFLSLVSDLVDTYYIGWRISRSHKKFLDKNPEITDCFIANAEMNDYEKKCSDEQVRMEYEEQRNNVISNFSIWYFITKLVRFLNECILTLVLGVFGLGKLGSLIF